MAGQKTAQNVEAETASGKWSAHMSHTKKGPDRMSR